MITDRQTKSLTKAIDKFNEDLSAFTKANGDCELPTIDSTIIGYEPAQPYTYQVLKTRIKVTDADGEAYTITDEYELDEVKESLKYDRRRLAKAWRVFESDNPDLELEHDTDDNNE